MVAAHVRHFSKHRTPGAPFNAVRHDLPESQYGRVGAHHKQCRQIHNRKYPMIQKTTLEDVPAVLARQHLCCKESAMRYNDFNIQPLKQGIDEIRTEFRGHVFYEIVIDSKIIGSVRGNEYRYVNPFFGQWLVGMDY
jgi:hypothetical protein